MQYWQIRTVRNVWPGFRRQPPWPWHGLVLDQLHQQPQPAQAGLAVARIVRGRRAMRTPGIGRRSGSSGASSVGPRAMAPPTVTIQRVATAMASQHRAARSGSVIWVGCHCHPPRLPHVQHCSHPPRRACPWASQSSGGRSVSTNHGSACPSPHHAPSVPSSRPSAEAKAVPRPRQQRPTGPTRSRTQTNCACPAGRNGPPWLIRRNRCQTRRTIRRNRQRAYPPRSANTSACQPDGMADRSTCSIRNHSRRHVPLWLASRIVQATGMAHPHRRPAPQSGRSTWSHRWSARSGRPTTGVPFSLTTGQNRSSRRRLRPALSGAARRHAYSVVRGWRPSDRAVRPGTSQPSCGHTTGYKRSQNSTAPTRWPAVW